MNKRALHLTHTLIETDSRILKEIRCLLNAGYSVSGIGTALEEGVTRPKTILSAKIINIVLYSRALIYLPRIARHAFSLFELTARMLLHAIRSRPDVIHCHDTIVLPLGCLVKLLTGAKLIYDAHELESDRNGLTSLHSYLTLAVERILWIYVDGQIVVSPSIQEWYQNTLGPKMSTVILNSPVASPNNRSHHEYLRTKFNIPPDELIFIYVGFFAPGRGLEMMAESFAKNEISAHIVFLGYGNMNGYLLNYERNNLNIHVHQSVSHDQVVEIAASADYGMCLIENVSLSDYYSLPNKLFEYAFAGIPVVASSFPDIKIMVDEYSLGICCDLSVSDLTVAVKQLQLCGRHRLSADLSSISWEAQEYKLSDFYQNLLQPLSI